MSRSSKWTGPALLAVAGAALLVPGSRPAQADTGTVTVSAATQSSFSLTLDTGAVPFGTNLGPDAVASNAVNTVGYLDADNGAYYVKNGSAGVHAVVATVKSTAPWTGSVSAAENTGSGGITIAGGGLRWSLGDIGSLAAAKAGIPFSTSGDGTAFDTASTCLSGSTKNAGVCSYNFDYSLRVRWTDTAGTFTSVITYSASQ